MRLNSFVLPDDIIQKMKDSLGRTHKIGLEHGFVLCSRNTPDGDILTDNSHCAGTECEITLKPTCKDKHETFVGSYHTHPDDTSLISEIDMKGSCYRKIDCIGGEKDNRISCFVTKKHIDKDMCKMQADISHRTNISVNNESDKIDKEKEMLLKIIDNYNSKVTTSKGYSRKLEIAEKSLKRLKDELNARIKKNNNNIEEYWRFRNEITNKYYNIYDVNYSHLKES